jgi:hypothetical protein
MPANGMLAARCNEQNFGTSRWQLKQKCYIHLASKRKRSRQTFVALHPSARDAVDGSSTGT